MKVKCITTDDVDFTVGKIYTISIKGLKDDAKFNYTKFLEKGEGTILEKWHDWCFYIGENTTFEEIPEDKSKELAPKGFHFIRNILASNYKNYEGQAAYFIHFNAYNLNNKLLLGCFGLYKRDEPDELPLDITEEMAEYLSSPNTVHVTVEGRIESVDHPSHYNEGEYEVIDVIEDWGLGEGFNLGNAIKYIGRAGHKGNKIEDLKKALWYVEREIKRLED